MHAPGSVSPCRGSGQHTAACSTPLSVSSLSRKPSVPCHFEFFPLLLSHGRDRFSYTYVSSKSSNETPREGCLVQEKRENTLVFLEGKSIHSYVIAFQELRLLHLLP